MAKLDPGHGTDTKPFDYPPGTLLTDDSSDYYIVLDTSAIMDLNEQSVAEVFSGKIIDINDLRNCRMTSWNAVMF